MGRRRPRAASGFWSRVRWGNVGRLVALVVAVLLIVLGFALLWKTIGV